MLVDYYFDCNLFEFRALTKAFKCVINSLTLSRNVKKYHIYTCTLVASDVATVYVTLIESISTDVCVKACKMYKHVKFNHKWLVLAL